MGSILDALLAGTRLANIAMIAKRAAAAVNVSGSFGSSSNSSVRAARDSPSVATVPNVSPTTRSAVSWEVEEDNRDQLLLAPTAPLSDVERSLIPEGAHVRSSRPTQPG